MIKKIVAIGPESTGKSTLCEKLANYFNTTWCPEYARAYLNENGVKYGYDDVKKIAEGQLIMEDYCADTASDKSLLLFIDTNMYVMKVWYEYVFDRCEFFVLDEIAKRSYDLYLLCDVDLPWVDEPMREYPDEQPRKELYEIYRDILINQKTAWVEISGTYDERLNKAIEAVKIIAGN